MPEDAAALSRKAASHADGRPAGVASAGRSGGTGERDPTTSAPRPGAEVDPSSWRTTSGYANVVRDRPSLHFDLPSMPATTEPEHHELGDRAEEPIIFGRGRTDRVTGRAEGPEATPRGDRRPDGDHDLRHRRARHSHGKCAMTSRVAGGSDGRPSPDRAVRPRHSLQFGDEPTTRSTYALSASPASLGARKAMCPSGRIRTIAAQAAMPNAS